jgi:phosphohistidine phosphatase
MTSTQLYLIRHGIAEDSDQYIQDGDRRLTPKGQRKTQQIAKRLRTLELTFDLILSSPLVRAYQTAEILKSEGLSCNLERSTDLAPSGSFDCWLRWLETWRRSGGTSLALVGHQPDLSQWAECLIWGVARQSFVLKKAGIIGLTLPASGSPVSHSLLFWLTAPSLLL